MKAAVRRPMAPQAGRSSGGARTQIIAGALFFLTLLLFARVTGGSFEFVNYDDPDYVTKNPHVQARLSAATVRWALTSGDASNWHPLTWMTHAMDWSLWRDNPRGHHATNIVLHALNAALAFLAFRRLTGAVLTSAVCAALFAWHPLRVESVAWVAERKDVLSGFFWFLVLWAYAGYAEGRRDGGGRGGRYYVIALLAFALGLMAKPMLVTLPCVLLLLDVWPLKRLTAAEWKSALLEKVPYFVLAGISSYVTFHVQKAGGSVAEVLGFGARLDNAVVSVARYLGKFAWPFDLAVLYPHPGDWPRAKVWGAVSLILALSTLAVVQWRRRPWLAVGWCWFLGTLVPVIGLVQVGMQSMADRYTYLPMLGVQVALLWTCRDLARTAPQRRGLWVGAAVLGLAGCAVRTWRQLDVWRNSETLFTHAIEVTRDNFVAYDNRGLYRFEHGQSDAALADYRQALAINPRYMNPNNNLGHALAELGQPAEALPFYRAALALKPEHVEVRNNLANALSDLGQLDEATVHYDFVLAREPDHVNALNGSAVVLAMRGQPADARQRLEHALRIAPDNASAHNNLGNVCSMLGQLEDAATHYRRAAALKPDAHTHALLGYTLARLGRRDEAVRELQAALRLNPNHAQARNWLQELGAKQ